MGAEQKASGEYPDALPPVLPEPGNGHLSGKQPLLPGVLLVFLLQPIQTAETLGLDYSSRKVQVFPGDFLAKTFQFLE